MDRTAFEMGIVVGGLMTELCFMLTLTWRGLIERLGMILTGMSE